MAEYKDKWCQEAYNKGFREGQDIGKGQLIRAKELIKTLLLIADNKVSQMEFQLYVADAKKFINEVER